LILTWKEMRYGYEKEVFRDSKADNL
jgi:hypothetical protein